MSYTFTINYESVDNGAIITEYDEEDAPLKSVAEDDNLRTFLGGILLNEIVDGANVTNAKITINIEEL